jgi:hypothetical protein
MRRAHLGGRRVSRRIAAALAAITLMPVLGTSSAGAQTGCPSPNPQPNPYPNCEYPTPHTLGMFDKLQLGSFAFSAGDELVTNRYSGMPFQHMIWDFTLHNKQDKFYYDSNAIQPGTTAGSLAAFPWLGVSLQEAPTGGMVPDPRYQSWGGSATQTQVGDKLEYSTTTANGLETIVTGPNTFEYKTANNAINITGTRAGGGTTWQLPWKEPNGSTNTILYNIEAYTVTGTRYGEPVKGHVAIESQWGTVPYRTAWWTRNRIGSWAFFVTNYKNGNSEVGQLLCGEYGLRGAIVTDRSGRSSVQTTNINTYDKPYGYLMVFERGEKFKVVDDKSASSGVFHFGEAYRPGDKNKVESSDVIGGTFGRQCTPQNLHDNR